MKRFFEKKQEVSEPAVRESICQAAMEVLGEVGLEKLTMQRVASRAGIATGTLYNYFKDKDALLVSVAERLFGEIRKQMRQAMETHQDTHVTLLEMIRCPFRFFNENISYFQFLDRAQVYTKMHQSIKENHVMEERRMIGQVLRKGIDEGIFRKIDVERTADFFQRAVVGTICVKPELEVFDPDKEAQSLAEMFFTYLE